VGASDARPKTSGGVARGRGGLSHELPAFLTDPDRKNRAARPAEVHPEMHPNRAFVILRAKKSKRIKCKKWLRCHGFLVAIPA